MAPKEDNDIVRLFVPRYVGTVREWLVHLPDVKTTWPQRVIALADVLVGWEAADDDYPRTTPDTAEILVDYFGMTILPSVLLSSPRYVPTAVICLDTFESNLYLGRSRLCAGHLSYQRRRRVITNLARKKPAVTWCGEARIAEAISAYQACSTVLSAGRAGKVLDG